MKIKKLIVLVLCFWFFIIPLAAQEITLSGSFEPKDKAAAYVAVLGNMGQNAVLAEAKVLEGNYSITLPANTPQGVYKLAFGMQEQPTFYFIHEGKENYVLNFSNTNNAWRLYATSSNNQSYVSNYQQKKDSLIATISTLYSFVQNYPHTKEPLHQSAIKTLNEKIKTFQSFEATAIAKAPQYSKEILQQNKMFFHKPQWDNKTIENNFLEALWSNIPIADTLYYKKPYLGEKLKATFEGVLEDKIITEAEKYNTISTRLEWLMQKLKTYPQHQKYYNLCLFYFFGNNYPYLTDQIDHYLNSKELLNAQETENFNYRKSQQELLGKVAPPIINENNINALDSFEANPSVVVFVAGNSPYSFQLLNQLKEATASSTTYQKVIAVLLTDDKESIANFKNRFPTWQVVSVAKDTINDVAKSYKLVYAPVAFLLDKNKTIIKKLEPFEPLE